MRGGGSFDAFDGELHLAGIDGHAICRLVIGLGDGDGFVDRRGGRDVGIGVHHADRAGLLGDGAACGIDRVSVHRGAPAGRVGQLVSQLRDVPLCADGERQREAVAILGIPGGLAWPVKGQVADRAGVGITVRVFQRDLDWEDLVRVRCGGIRGGFDFLCHGERAGRGGRGIGIFEGTERDAGSRQIRCFAAAGNGEERDGWNQLAVAFCDGDGDCIDCIIVVHAGDRGRLYLFDGVDVRSGSLEGQLAEGCDILLFVFDLLFGERNFRLFGQRGRCRIGAGCFQLEGHGAVIDGLSFAGGIGFGSPEAGERAGIIVILVIAVDDGNDILLSGFFDLAGGLFSGLTIDCGAPVLGKEVCGFLHAPGGAEGQVEEGEGFVGVDVVGRRFAACKFQLAGLCVGVSDLAGIGDFAVVSAVIQRDFQRVSVRKVRRRAGEVGYGLADLQAADARVGDDDGGFAAEQAREVAVA